MKTSFTNKDGAVIVDNLIAVIQANKQYLSDIDGAIGDGDHGINMNKGFTLTQEKLKAAPADLPAALAALSHALMAQVGGSMGPLYGMFFRSLGKVAQSAAAIDAYVLDDMFNEALASIQKISDAQPGDKTLIDVLVPAVHAYHAAVAAEMPWPEALAALKTAATQGRDGTRDMVAKKGRSSRLGERSRGVIDAGAASCSLILHSIADSILALTK